MGVKNLLSDIARPLVSECSPDLAFCLVFYLDKKYIKFSTKSSANDLFIKLFSSYTRCHVQNAGQLALSSLILIWNDFSAD